MCGIIFSKSFNPKRKVGKAIRKAYFRQKNRGQNGYGFISIHNNKLKFVRTIFEHQILKALADYNSTEIMFHHRIPTSTENATKYNHPIMALNDNYNHNYYFIHNGMISNKDEVKKEHNDLGIRYFTDIDDKYNDSECLLHELALYLEGIKDKKEFKARGSMAFVLLQTDKKNKPLNLYFGRNELSPLKIVYDPEEALLLTSAGLGKEVDKNILHRFNYTDRKISTEAFMFPDYYSDTSSSYSYNGYGVYGCGSGYDDDDYVNKYGKEFSQHNLLTSGDIKEVSYDGNIRTLAGAELDNILSNRNQSALSYFHKQKEDYNSCLTLISGDRGIWLDKLKLLNIEHLSNLCVAVNDRIDEIKENIQYFRRDNSVNALARWTVCLNVQKKNREFINNRVDALSNEI